MSIWMISLIFCLFLLPYCCTNLYSLRKGSLFFYDRTTTVELFNHHDIHLSLGSIRACKKAALECDEAKFEQYKLAAGDRITPEIIQSVQSCFEKIRGLESWFLCPLLFLFFLLSLDERKQWNGKLSADIASSSQLMAWTEGTIKVSTLLLYMFYYVAEVGGETRATSTSMSCASLA